MLDVRTALKICRSRDQRRQRGVFGVGLHAIYLSDKQADLLAIGDIWS